MQSRCDQQGVRREGVKRVSGGCQAGGVGFVKSGAKIQKKTGIYKFLLCFQHKNTKKYIFSCIYQKKAVPLHDFKFTISKHHRKKAIKKEKERGEREGRKRSGKGGRAKEAEQRRQSKGGRTKEAEQRGKKNDERQEARDKKKE